MVGDLTDGGGGGGGAFDVLKGVWERKKTEFLAEAQKLIDKALVNYRGRHLTPAWFLWDSGADGTALTASSNRPNGWVEITPPCAFQAWRVTSYPSGSATVLVKSVEPGAALSTATTIATLTLSSNVEAASASTFTAIDLTAGTRLAAYLTSVTTCQVVAVSLEFRRQ